MRIGIDVGGTNTDAALMDGRSVVAEIKTPTTEDVTGGIVTALTSLLQTSGAVVGEIDGVMIGTTHFTNAVVEARRLMPTAVVRLGLPATAALPPLTAWPESLKGALGEHVYMCHGGHEFDGRVISPLDEGELHRAAADIAGKGVRTIAISSVFSPVTAEFEQRAAEIFAAEVPHAAISLSHEIGRMGLLERENATIMNACLRGLAAGIVSAFREALASLDIAAPVYISQNDGTLMSAEYTERYPVSTFASGPTNSMRGAAFLSGVENCAVVDVGGTTSDIGMLQHGFPRDASVAVEIGGVRTNFRMPDVLSIGIGGGSIVRDDDGLTIGPDSVGYRITDEALVFGGSTLTATDLAVAGGLADIGDAAGVAHIDRATIDRGLELITDRIAETVDRMRISAERIKVIAVGGGSILLPSELPGVGDIIKPDHFAVANAIGAAIAQVGAEVDRIFAMEGRSREDVLDEAKQEAFDRAVDAGAKRDSIGIIDVEEVPLAYLPSNAVRVRVKAVGDLDME
ncbi:hydantoinase/oxoprolinase family protein [bacterium]|nr:hydantoinase/oxoprolinase family protein [bacterium]